MSNIQIESDLKEILGKLLDKVNDIDKRLVRVETKLDSTIEDVKEIKGSQKAQIWTLIGILITAVGGFIVAVARSVLSFH